MTSPTKLRSLNSQQSQTLKKLEDAVWRGWESNLEAARALCTIQDEELYKGTHERFDDYVRERFDKTVQWAYDSACWWRINVIAGTEEAPLSMNATRHLKSLRDDPKVLKKIVTEAKKLAKAEKRAITGKDVKAAKEKILGKAKPAKVKPVKALPTVVGVVKLLKLVDKSLKSTKTKKLTAKQNEALKVQMETLEVVVASIKEVLASGGAEVGGTSAK